MSQPTGLSHEAALLQLPPPLPALPPSGPQRVSSLFLRCRLSRDPGVLGGFRLPAFCWLGGLQPLVIDLLESQLLKVFVKMKVEDVCVMFV